jgi:hypothetical protein
LSGLFLSWDDHKRLDAEKRLLQHFFEKCGERKFPNLLTYCQDIWDGRSGLVATVDTHAYAELRLTATWLFQRGKTKRDPRFLLRRALHQKRVARKFDIILVDCPPLLNMSCINALAASDYLLVPVLLARKTTERVAALLTQVRTLKRTSTRSSRSSASWQTARSRVARSRHSKKTLGVGSATNAWRPAPSRSICSRRPSRRASRSETRRPSRAAWSRATGCTRRTGRSPKRSRVGCRPTAFPRNGRR